MNNLNDSKSNGEKKKQTQEDNNSSSQDEPKFSPDYEKHEFSDKFEQFQKGITPPDDK